MRVILRFSHLDLVLRSDLNLNLSSLPIFMKSLWSVSVSYYYLTSGLQYKMCTFTQPRSVTPPVNPTQLGSLSQPHLVNPT